MPPEDFSNQLALLKAQIEDLASNVQKLLERTPSNQKVWLRVGEFGKLCGLSPEGLRDRRNRGCFRTTSLRPLQRGQRLDWFYHRHDALEDIQNS